jgi:chromosomal replication initiator protein
VAYVSSENFLNDLVNAIQSHDVVEFRNTYRTYDILMIDDIQFIAGKERTQEEFFHTFNDLYNSLRQIVLTSDRSPREMATLEDRLRSRFEWGMIADLQPPDLETRVAILKKKATLFEVELPDEVSYLIANHIKADVRKLEGALNRLVLQCSTILRQRTITEEMAQTVLHDMLDRSELAITVERIQEVVSAHFKVPLQLMLSNKRSKEVAMARQVAMYLSRELTKSSLPDIGKQFHKDHTTVIHGCDKIKRLMESDGLFKSEIDQLVSRLQE